MEGRCDVCFFRFQKTENRTKSNHFIIIVSEPIECYRCRLVAHRFCYLPQSTHRSFLCDGCQNNIGRDTKCFLCGNEGLMKRISAKKYAHPICLMLSRSSYVISYEKLDFFCLDENNRRKKKICSLCGKKDQNLLKCFEKSCDKYAHMFCILSVCYESD